MQSLCGKLYKEKNIFLNGSPCGADSVFISLCVRRCLREVQHVNKSVSLNLSVCGSDRVHCKCANVWECACTHRMPTVGREGEGAPPFCHFNPPPHTQ